MNRTIYLLLALAWAAPALAAKDETSNPNAVVATRGGVSLTLGDIDARMAEIPEDVRAGMYLDPKRMEASLSEQLLFKQLAREARAEGLDKDPKFKAALALLTDRLLASWRGEDLGKSAPKADFETLAHESYLTDPTRFTEPAKIKVRHVLIRTGPGCRTREMSLELAQKIRSDALAGKDFAALARQYSEDETSREAGGELPVLTPGKMLPAFETAAQSLAEPGAVSEVVTTKHGYHVIQLVSREPGRQLGYDEVKPELVKRLQKEHVDRFRREHVAQLRSMSVDSDPELLSHLTERYADKNAKPDGKAKPTDAPLLPDVVSPLLPKAQAADEASDDEQ